MQTYEDCTKGDYLTSLAICTDGNFVLATQCRDRHRVIFPFVDDPVYKEDSWISKDSGLHLENTTFRTYIQDMLTMSMHFIRFLYQVCNTKLVYFNVANSKHFNTFYVFNRFIISSAKYV